MFVATALVQFMTPGLALFYAGLTSHKSIVQLMIQNFVCLGLVSVLWVIYGFGLTFGAPMIAVTLSGTTFNLIGNPFSYFLWQGVEIYSALHRASDVVVCCFPGMLFAMYQGMFAAITPALASGAFVDRMAFYPFVTFVTLWLTFVYCPLGFWNWGGGWMFQLGAWDFAGGMVVHESAGFSALGALLVLGPRKFRKGHKAPSYHSIPMIMTGTALLWFGWFGFNGGSALTIGGLATIAFVNTQIAPAAAMMVWIFWEWLCYGRPTLSGACAGTLAGLVIITPSAGFIQPTAAILAGIIGGSCCFTSVHIVRFKTRLDDTCDAIGLHGVAGFIGTIFVGCLSDPIECQTARASPKWCSNPGTVTRSVNQTMVQIICATVAALFSFLSTYLIFLLMYASCFKVLRKPEEQQSCQDVPGHGEEAYAIGKACTVPSPDASEDEEETNSGPQSTTKQSEEEEYEEYTDSEEESEGFFSSLMPSAKPAPSSEGYSALAPRK